MSNETGHSTTKDQPLAGPGTSVAVGSREPVRPFPRFAIEGGLGTLMGHRDGAYMFVSAHDAEIAKAQTEIDRLRGIIARNAMQRLDGTKSYITPDDITVSLEIAEELYPREPNSAYQPRRGEKESP